MDITSGKIESAQKVIIYGPEGIGKSTFASKFPNPLFSDTEGSTKHMDVRRLPKPTSWTLLKEEVAYVKANPNVCKTYIIDTFDWAERLCIAKICSDNNKKSIEDFGYGSGYVYELEEIGRFLNSLDELIELGINVVLTAHAQLRKFEQPDEMGAYDRWELKLGKKTSSQISPILKEWADMILFVNYKTFSVATDDKGTKHKAQGGTRTMYTTHHPCWDAKNRHNLPDEMPFEYERIAHCFKNNAPTQAVTPTVAPHIEPTVSQIVTPPQEQTVTPPAPPIDTNASDERKEFDTPAQSFDMPNGNIPKALSDLMQINKVTDAEIRQAVAYKGYYPEDTPIENYDADFINGVLVGAWNQVFEIIKKMRNENVFQGGNE